MITSKRIKKETIRWIDNITIFSRSVFLTYHLWENLSEDKDEKTFYKIQKVNKRFLNNLERICNASKRRLERVIAIHRNTTRNHCHLAIEVPIHLSNKMMVENIKQCVTKTHGIGELKIIDTYDKKGLIDYISKEVNISRDTIDFENSFFKNNKNRISKYRNGHSNIRMQ